MNETLYVYRLVVEFWPTPDGQPWARQYGSNTAAPNHVIPSWLTPTLNAALPHLWEYRHPIAERLKYDSDRDELLGVLMPVPKRKHYLSGPGAYRVANDMRAFGAVVRVERSNAVTWGPT